MNRPIVDETNLQGAYDIALHGTDRTPDKCLQMLRDQSGIFNIEMLVVTIDVTAPSTARHP